MHAPRAYRAALRPVSDSSDEPTAYSGKAAKSPQSERQALGMYRRQKLMMYDLYVDLANL